MGQTLTHGIYLPNEGERNCYNGLAGNWTILDGAVGTVAEHTSALAGKAPLVHTHTKSDITDLFNSANTWSAENTYTNILLTLKHTELEIGVLPASNQTKRYRFADKNNANLGWVQHRVSASGDSFIELCSINRFSNGQLSPQGSDVANSVTIGLHSDGSRYLNVLGDVYPDLPTRVCNLGTSTNQWNNLYAKNYFYNGTAWGLDKANEWSANNKFTGNVSIEKNTASPTASSDTSLALTGNSQYIFFRTKGSSNYKTYNSFLWGGYLNGVNPYRYGRIRLYRASAIYGETGEETPDTSFSFIDVALHYKWVSLTDNVKFINDGTTNACEPLTNNATDLGTSTNKWKSLNGINPGALSIFNPSATQDPIDVPNTWVTNGSAWNTLNVSNMGDGWICLTYMLCGANNYILARFGGTRADIYPSMIFPAILLAESRYFVYALMPVAKAMGNIYLEINLDSNAVLVAHSFIPAYGTV